MAIEAYDNFKGLFTITDAYTNPGSPDLDNVDITITGDLKKAEGFELVNTTTVSITNITAAASALLTVASAADFVAACGAVMVRDVSASSWASALEGMVWNVTVASGSILELESADTSGLNPLEGNIKNNVLFNQTDDAGSITKTNITSTVETIESRIADVDTWGNIVIGAVTQPSKETFDGSSIDVNQLIIYGWVTPDFTAPGSGAVVKYIFRSKDDASGNPYVALYFDPTTDKIWVTLNDGVGGTASVSASVTWSIDSVNSFVLFLDKDASYDSKSIDLYINGSSVDTDTDTWTSFSMQSTTFIGAGGNSNIFFWYGGIHDLSIIDLSNLTSYTKASIVSSLTDNTYTTDTSYSFVSEFDTLNGVVDFSLADLTGFSDSSGIAMSSTGFLGSYDYEANDKILAFLSNGTESYLCETGQTTIAWEYVDASNVFDTSNEAYFVGYEGNAIFTKNESPTGFSGGTFYWDNSASSVALFGTANNPTGKYIESHNERIFIANIKEMAGVAQADAGSWVVVSKVIPEAVDTTHTIGSVAFASDEAPRGASVDVMNLVIASASAYAVGDTVYVTGVTVSGGGGKDINGKYYDVQGINASGYSEPAVVVYTDSQGHVASTGGTISLRGNTWQPSTFIYQNALQGAGVFRCDDNDSDEIVRIKSIFGNLVILREQSPYIFTGALESGSISLARALNVPYGAVSPHVTISDGGLWFNSQYGLSKVEGTAIKTARTELDNIVSITPTANIQPTYDAISTKSSLRLHYVGTRVWMHDASAGKTYILDTLNGQWVQHSGKLIENIINVGEDVYSLYKMQVFKMNEGNQVFNFTSQQLVNMASYYCTNIRDQGSPVNSKDYNMLYTLLQAQSSSEQQLSLTYNTYFNGKINLSEAIPFDIKTGTLLTWDSVTTSGTVTWNSVTTTGTVTWNSISGEEVSMVERKKYRLGTGKSLQFKLEHNDNSEFKVSKFFVNYDMLDIDTI